MHATPDQIWKPESQILMAQRVLISDMGAETFPVGVALLQTSPRRSPTI
jgi:hypothetical protein